MGCCASTEEVSGAQPAPDTVTIQASVKWDDGWQDLAKAPNALFIDTRTPEEFSQKSITGSVNLPVRMADDPVVELSTAKAKQLLGEDMNRPILVWCAVGGRSHRAAEGLRSLGFTNVKNGGGIDEVKMLLEGGSK
mmetsp:Transcript_73536/g.208239  ORF Transcript_73536/g.208239 Transcript_73536/m.208239 type:complete len:136 (+) Transcript_73536:54-461(+)